MTPVRSGRLARNSLYGIATTVVNSASGAVFWLVAARTLEPSAVGLASGLVATMTVVGLASNLGTTTALIDVLPKRAAGADWSRALTAMTLLALAGAVAGAVVTVVLLGRTGSDLSAVAGDAGRIALFVVGVPVWSAFALKDHLFIAERRVDYALLTAVAFAVLRLVAIGAAAIVGVASTFVLFAIWIGSAAVVDAWVGFRVVHRLERGFRASADGIGRELVQLRRRLAGHHLVNLAGPLLVFTFPAVVTARLSATDNAYFYAAWMFSSLFFVVSPTVSSSLFAEGSHGGGKLAAQARTALGFIAALLVPAMVVVVLAGHAILGLFGPEYADAGYPLLLLLLVSAVPDALTNVATAVLLSRGQLRAGAAVNVVIATTALVVTWILLPPLGILGVGWGFLAGQCAGLLTAGALWATGRRTAPTPLPAP